MRMNRHSTKIPITNWISRGRIGSFSNHRVLYLLLLLFSLPFINKTTINYYFMQFIDMKQLLNRMSNKIRWGKLRRKDYSLIWYERLKWRAIWFYKYWNSHRCWVPKNVDRQRSDNNKRTYEKKNTITRGKKSTDLTYFPLSSLIKQFRRDKNKSKSIRTLQQ